MNVEGALTWAFEFEDQPYFAGFLVLSSNGIYHTATLDFKLPRQGGSPGLVVTRIYPAKFILIAANQPVTA